MYQMQKHFDHATHVAVCRFSFSPDLSSGNAVKFGKLLQRNSFHVLKVPAIKTDKELNDSST